METNKLDDFLSDGVETSVVRPPQRKETLSPTIDVNRELTNLRGKVEILKEAEKRSREKLAIAENEKQKLELELNEAKKVSVNEELKQKFEEMKIENERLNNCSLERYSLQKKVKELETRLLSSSGGSHINSHDTSKIVELEQEVLDLKKIELEKDKLIKEKEAAIKELSNENKQLIVNAKADSAHQRLDELTEENDRKRKEMVKLHRKGVEEIEKKYEMELATEREKYAELEESIKQKIIIDEIQQSRFQQTIERLQKENVQLNSNIEELNKKHLVELQQKSIRIKELESKLENARRIELEKENLTQSVMRLESEHKNRLIEHEKYVESLNEQLRAAQTEVFKLTSELQLSATIGIELKQANDKNERLSAKIKELEKEKNTAAITLQGRDTEIKSAKARIGILQIEVDALTKDLEQKNKEISEVRMSNNTSNSLDTNDLYARIDDLQKRLQKSEAETAKLTQENEQVSEDLVELQTQHRSLQKELDHNREMSSEYQVRIEELTTSVEMSNSAKHVTEQQLTMTRNELSTTKDSLRVTEAKLAQALWQVSSAESKISTLQQEKMTAETRLTEKSIKVETDITDHQIQDLQLELNNTQSQLRLSNQKLEAALDEEKHLMAEIELLKVKLQTNTTKQEQEAMDADLNHQVKLLETKQKERDAAMLPQVEEKLRSAQAELESMQTQLETLTKEKQLLRATVDRLNQASITNVDEITQLKTQVRLLKHGKSSNTLLDLSEQIGSKEKEIDEVKDRNKWLENRVKTLQEEIVQHQEANRKLDGERKDEINKKEKVEESLLNANKKV